MSDTHMICFRLLLLVIQLSCQNKTEQKQSFFDLLTEHIVETQSKVTHLGIRLQLFLSRLRHQHYSLIMFLSLSPLMPSPSKHFFVVNPKLLSCGYSISEQLFSSSFSFSIDVYNSLWITLTIGKSLYSLNYCNRVWLICTIWRILFNNIWHSKMWRQTEKGLYNNKTCPWTKQNWRKRTKANLTHT